MIRRREERTELLHGTHLQYLRNGPIKTIQCCFQILQIIHFNNFAFKRCFQIIYFRLVVNVQRLSIIKYQSYPPTDSSRRVIVYIRLGSCIKIA